MVEGRFGTTEGRRPRAARGRPNWWVILAVSLALMALLVATAGTSPRATKHPHGLANAAASDTGHAAGSRGTRGSTGSTGSTGGARAAHVATTTTMPPSASDTSASGTSLLSSHALSGVGTPTTAPASVTTTTAPAAPPTTTTTTTAPTSGTSSANDRTEGILNPPGQRSNGFAFTGMGPTTISVLWSGSTYLTLEASCPNGSQSAGGTSAMQTTLPDASGSCMATVSEPASESTPLTYTITIGPAGG